MTFNPLKQTSLLTPSCGQQASPVKTSASVDECKDSKESGQVFSGTSSGWFAELSSLDTSPSYCWRTSQRCLVQTEAGQWVMWSGPWHRAGMMRSGRAFRVEPVSEHRTLETGHSLLPTPSARDWRSGKASSQTLEKNSRPLNETIVAQEGGSHLNPTFLEWMMGFPLGHTGPFA